MRTREEKSPKPHEDSVASIVPHFVGRREKNERGRQISEEMLPSVKATPPTQAKRRKEKGESDHPKLETLACKKAEPNEGEDREAKRQGETMSGAGKRYRGPHSVDVSQYI